MMTYNNNAGYDFYQYGGLLREVTLHVLPEAGTPHIQRVTVAPLGTGGDAPTPTGKVDVSVVVMDASSGAAAAAAHGSSSSDASGTVQLKLCWDLPAGSPPCSAVYKEYTYAAATGVVSIPSLAVPKARPWDTASPKLHTLTVFSADGSSGAQIRDSVQVRFGLRIVSTSGRHILLNGKPVKLHGYNRHDM